MFKPIRPHKKNIDGKDKEPSLRIGRKVPDDAVNLAYYYNPTATDAEKVLTADAPRNTIDHRVEEAYRYLFNQASNDDNLFPASIMYSDEEGYSGVLGRMYTRWNQEAHVQTKYVTQSKEYLGLLDKTDVPKMISYAGDDGYIGNLYLDAVSYTVTETKDLSINDMIERTVLDHEIQQLEIDASSLEQFKKDPNTDSSSPWPSRLSVNQFTVTNVDGSIPVLGPNNYDGFTGELRFSNVEVEPIQGTASVSEIAKSYSMGTIKSNTVKDTDIVNKPKAAELLAKAEAKWKDSYRTTYNKAKGKYENTEILEFLALVEQSGSTSTSGYEKIQTYVGNPASYDIIVEATSEIKKKESTTDLPDETEVINGQPGVKTKWGIVRYLGQVNLENGVVTQWYENTEDNAGINDNIQAAPSKIKTADGDYNGSNNCGLGDFNDTYPYNTQSFNHIRAKHGAAKINGIPFSSEATNTGESGTTAAPHRPFIDSSYRQDATYGGYRLRFKKGPLVTSTQADFKRSFDIKWAVGKNGWKWGAMWVDNVWGKNAKNDTETIIYDGEEVSVPTGKGSNSIPAKWSELYDSSLNLPNGSNILLPPPGFSYKDAISPDDDIKYTTINGKRYISDSNPNNKRAYYYNKTQSNKNQETPEGGYITIGEYSDGWGNAKCYRDGGYDGYNPSGNNKFHRHAYVLYQVNCTTTEEVVVPGASFVNTYYTRTYKVTITQRGSEGSNKYNAYANYTGVLTKQNRIEKFVPYKYKANATYTGLVRNVWYDYDGMAYYRGSVVKTKGIGNVNADLSNELLMFPDDSGYLRTVDVNGNNYYKVEAEQFHITDVFKDGVPCFYEHKLKYPIYDYRGPDENGFYEGNAVKVFTSNLKDLPNNYKYQLKLKTIETETITEVIDGSSVTKTIPKKYEALLYSSFISKTTDTYKASYNAYLDTVNLDSNQLSGVTEDIYNRPFMHKGKDFMVVPVHTKSRTNRILMIHPSIINDTRRYITFNYTIRIQRNSDGTIFTSYDRTASILNRDYAVESEYDKFIGRSMIVSPKNQGIYMTPMEIILEDQAASGITPIITADSKDFVFSVIISNIPGEFRGAVNIKCNTDGSGLVMAETSMDTGFMNDATLQYTKKLCINNPYLVENGKIYSGYQVKCLDVRNIAVRPPRESHLLESWYPLLQFGHYSQVMDQYGTHYKVVYSMPEYDKQLFSPQLGKPYVEIKDEQAEILNPHMLKVKNFPLYIPESSNGAEGNLVVHKRVGSELTQLSVKAVSFSEGIIIMNDVVNENDDIIVDYIYMEEYFVYRGFWRDVMDYCRIDLNPNQYHTYSNMAKIPSELQPTTNLFNKTIYFFMRPRIEYEIDGSNDDLIDTDESKYKVVIENENCLYHKIDDQEPDGDHDIYIGSVYIRQNTSLYSTILIDTRTRGGGIGEEIKDSLRRELEPESDFYLDIGYYDGKPYQENGVIIIRLDNSILQEFGGKFTQQDVEEKVKRWLGFGIYPIIEYVDSYAKYDMPQYTLNVEDSYTNVINEIPEITLDCVII